MVFHAGIPSGSACFFLWLSTAKSTRARAAMRTPIFLSLPVVQVQRDVLCQTVRKGQTDFEAS